MQTTLYYFLQVVFCSAIMMGYYWLVLRDNKFHQYNRFYLLAIALLSWIVPLIKIQWNDNNYAGDTQIYYLLSAVASNNTELETSFSQHWYSISWQRGLQLLYMGGALILFISMILSLIRIFQLLKRSSAKKMGTINLIMTNAKGTPYSFFRFIFWNEAIDLSSSTGQQILQHEITHVKEKHSFDKLLMQCILIAGWLNPIFWWIQKELHMIHEFIADKKSVESGDTASLAQMLLTAAYPQQTFKLTNPFFFSPIKRRIAMLSKSNTKFSYLRRLIVLPLLAIIIVLVAFRNAPPTQPITVETVVKTIYNDVTGDPLATIAPLMVDLKKDYTIVINAGHGGLDKGSVGVDGKSVESQLTLELAETIKALNQNSRLNLVFTRTEDETQSVMEIAQKANKSNPDLFLSLHYNAAKNPTISGTEIYIANPAKTNNYQGHLQFANQLANQLDDLNMTFNGIKSRQAGVYILQNINCPSVLIEAGYLSNSADFEKIKTEEFRKQLAVAVLNGIQKYLSANENNLRVSETNLPKSDTVKLLVKKVESELGKKSVDSVQVFSITKDNDFWNNSLKLLTKNGQKPLLILNGQRVENDNLAHVGANEIQYINVLKNESATIKYGSDGKNGVIEIITKNADLSFRKDNNDRSGIKSFMKRNNEVANVSWNHQLKTMEILLKDGTQEKYILNNAASMRRAEEKYGELPIPAPPPPPALGYATKVNKESFDKVFAKTEVPAEFKGGLKAWAKFLNQNIKREIPIERGGPPGKYTVNLSFIIDKEGKLSEIKTENNPGYGTAEEAVRVMNLSPDWEPAKQNGKAVTYKHKQSFTFVIPQKAKLDYKKYESQ